MRIDGCGRHAVRAVHVEPHAPFGADVRDRADRVDRAGERGTRRGHDGDRRDAGGQVAIDRLGQRLGPHPARIVDRQVTQVVRSDPQQLDRACDRVVHLGGAVDRQRPPRQPFDPRPRERLLTRRCERGDVADRPAARERSDRRGEPDELADPPDRLVLDLRRGPRIDRQVDVVRVCQQVRDRADLQSRRTDEREVPRPRLRDRLVQDARGVVECLVHRDGLGRQPGLEEPPHALVERGLLGPVPVEAPPRLLHQPGRVREDLLARRVEPERSVGLRHGDDGTAVLRHPLPS